MNKSGALNQRETSDIPTVTWIISKWYRSSAIPIPHQKSHLCQVVRQHLEFLLFTYLLT